MKVSNIVKIVKDPRLPNKLSYLISPMQPVSVSSGGSFTHHLNAQCTNNNNKKSLVMSISQWLKK